MKVQSLGGEWLFREVDEDRWLPAEVPGSVHVDLLRAGRIPDPFVGDAEKRVQWVAERDWIYRKTFEVDGALWEEDRIALVCDGLDTLAEVRLNGRVLSE
ncbi:MAG: glycosyl hydrolase 2 galactose-binding domain-containing protein, partial [Anaerolineae bacterium]